MSKVLQNDYGPANFALISLKVLRSVKRKQFVGQDRVTIKLMSSNTLPTYDDNDSRLMSVLLF